MFNFNIYNKLGKNARKAMIISNLISIITCAIILLVIRFVLNSFSIPKRIFLVYDIVSVIIFFFFIMLAILECTIAYNRNRYKISDVSVEKISGIIFVSKSVVPIRRIQQVSVTEGPILKFFNLCNLQIVTAGGDITIEYLPIEVAEEIATKLRAYINEFAEKQLLNTEEYKGIIKNIDDEAESKDKNKK